MQRDARPLPGVDTGQSPSGRWDIVQFSESVYLEVESKLEFFRRHFILQGNRSTDISLLNKFVKLVSLVVCDQRVELKKKYMINFLDKNKYDLMLFVYVNLTILMNWQF